MRAPLVGLGHGPTRRSTREEGREEANEPEGRQDRKNKVVVERGLEQLGKGVSASPHRLPFPHGVPVWCFVLSTSFPISSLPSLLSWRRGAGYA